jgi:hypothetical protein
VLRPWLADLAAETSGAIPLRQVAASRGSVSVAAVRLPGWHRGGYGLWDGESWTWAEAAEGARSPRAWDPAIFHGHWEADRWGMGRFVVQRWTAAK